MEKIKRNFGFGMMRLPMAGDEVDLAQVRQMVDLFLARGFNYFDTAHGYLDGKSETAIRACLTSRYPRESYVLTNKLSGNFFEKEEDIRPLLARQLEACGVDYFDFFLMHAQSARNYEHFRQCRAYETAFALKREGKLRHVGISFHDTPEMLERILTDYPEIEVVQIQFNYLDYDDPAIQSRAVYETARRHGKPLIIMEPVKGGRLVELPAKAEEVLSALGGGSPASYAIRFAAGFEGVMMVLSGMSTIGQVEDNSAFMADFRPLNEGERAAVAEVQRIFKTGNYIPCTACRYCTPGCPAGIAIPDVFSIVNARKLHERWDGRAHYAALCAAAGSRASDCVGCGQCEAVCPQHLEIRALLKAAAAELEG